MAEQQLSEPTDTGIGSSDSGVFIDPLFELLNDMYETKAWDHNMPR